MIARRFLHDGSGSSAVEFAMLSPIFFGIAFGVIDAGRLAWTQMTIEHAVEFGGPLREPAIVRLYIGVTDLVLRHHTGAGPGLVRVRVLVFDAKLRSASGGELQILLPQPGVSQILFDNHGASLPARAAYLISVGFVRAALFRPMRRSP